MKTYKRPEMLDTPETRKKFVASLAHDVRAAKSHWESDFKRMIEDMEIARTGAPKRWPKSYYTVNITQRFIRQKVASLYAKNPQAKAKRRKRLNFQIWDEDPETLMMSLQQVQQAAMAGQVPDQNALAIVAEVEQAKLRNTMLDRQGKTLECLWDYFTNEQTPTFKSVLKKAVRSAVQTSIGYVKLGFQRETDLDPRVAAKIADHQERLAEIERLQMDLRDTQNDVDAESKEVEELKMALQSLHDEPMVIVREGITYDFRFVTSIIPDPSVTSLTDWADCDWIADERFFRAEEVRKYFGVDLPANFEGFYNTRQKDYKRNPRKDIRSGEEKLVCVWFIEHKPTGMVYTVCDGYEDFLEEPTVPDVQVEQFFTIYPLCYNELLHPTSVFPNSDVRTMLPAQEEMNRARQGLREHREANRPGYALAGGSMDEETKQDIGSHEAFAVVEFPQLQIGQKITDILQALPKMDINPAMYETGSAFDDIMLSVGAQEATFGATGNATATEASIAESNRTASLEGEIDELNDFLSRLARDSAQVMLQELDIETVQSIVGPGAVWPEMNREEIMAEVSLEVVAGSNGRPNRAMRQQALQMLLPFLIQVPGVDPIWMARMLIESIDDSIDLTEAIMEGLPSIMSMNQQSQVSAASGTEDDPEAQGGRGSANAPVPPAAQGDSKSPGRPPMPVPHVAGGEVIR